MPEDGGPGPAGSAYAPGDVRRRTATGGHCRAIAHRPRVIFADEPTAELDTNTGLQVVKIFKELNEREGITIIMTTHDTGLMEIGDRVYELQDGEIIHAE